VLGFFDVIEQSAMHIYHSTLPWSPTSSPTRQLYQRQLTPKVKLMNAIDAYWDPWIKTIPIQNSLIATAFSHNGSTLAVVSKGYVKIIETETGAVTLEVDESAISVNFSPNDDMIVCGFEDGMVRAWNVQTSELIRPFVGHQGRVSSVIFSPCGSMIVSAGQDKTVRIWNVSSGHCKCVLEGHSNWVSAVCWSGTGDLVISGSWDASIRVWNVSTQECLINLREHLQGVTCVASSSDNSLITSGSMDGAVKVYDGRSGDVLRTISTNDWIYSVQFSTHDDKLLYTNRHSATIWDLYKKMQVSTMDCDGYRSAFSPDATRIASGSDRFVNVKILNTGNGDQNSEAVNHNPTKDITFSPDGCFIASRSLSDVKIWDTTSCDCLFTSNSHNFVETVVFSPDSAFVACWSGDSHPEVQVWNIHTRSQVKSVRLDFERFSNNVALSPCGGRLVCLSSSHITLFDLGSGKDLARLDFDSEFWWASQIAFAVDGTSIFVHKGDNIKHRWRISENDHDDPVSNTDQSTSLPLVFTPMEEPSSDEIVPVPRQCCRYEGDEWILNEDGMRILWLPPDRRGVAMARGKKITVGTNASGRVYLADFSDGLGEISDSVYEREVGLRLVWYCCSPTAVAEDL
jgi:WD40 repeat protein